MVPVPVAAPYLDHKMPSVPNFFGENLAFLHFSCMYDRALSNKGKVG
jgi:hypothetical protein